MVLILEVEFLLISVGFLWVRTAAKSVLSLEWWEQVYRVYLCKKQTCIYNKKGNLIFGFCWLQYGKSVQKQEVTSIFI